MNSVDFEQHGIYLVSSAILHILRLYNVFNKQSSNSVNSSRIQSETAV